MPANDLNSITSRPLQRIILTGFMGSGKSTVGELLASRIGWRFADLDREIESRSGQSVPEIFSTQGEAHFRAAETAALGDVLTCSHIVIALGGGAPESAENRRLLRQVQRTSVVFLDGPFHVLYDRCIEQSRLPQATDRPILADPQNAEDRYRTRVALYREVSSMELSTAARLPAEVVDVIVAALRLG